MPIFGLEVDIAVQCDTCRNPLSAEVLHHNYGNEPTLRVEICDNCLEIAKDEADDVGYSRGYEDGTQEGSADDQ
jgi:hypothetical protein